MATPMEIPPDTSRRLVLRRAESERLTVHRPSGVMSSHGRRLPDHLAPAVLELLIEGHLYAHPLPSDPAQFRVCITNSGVRLLRALQAERQRKLAATRAAVAKLLAHRPGDAPTTTNQEEYADVAAMGAGRAVGGGDCRTDHPEFLRPTEQTDCPQRHQVTCP